MEWISVEERLPEEPAWVLVCSNGAMNCMAFHDEKWVDWTFPKASNIVIGDITHWMSLPESPKLEMEEG